MFQSSHIEASYLSGEISDADVVAYFQNRRRDAIKSEGAVYTPAWIVRAMLEKIDLSSTSQSIIEPSCGHGSFVLPLIEYAVEELNLTWEEGYDWFRSQVTCCDIDSDTVSELRVIVAMYFRRKGVSRASSCEMENIKVQDGLKVSDAEFDIALGNPPYIRTQALEADYLSWLRKTFEIAHSGNIDIYYAFLDKYSQIALRTVFIVPNGFIKATGARILRNRIFPKISEIVDFRSRLVFPNARTYTCIVTMDQDHEGHVRYIDAPADRQRNVAWHTLTGSEIHTAKRVALSGVATLSDSIFRVHQDPDSGDFFCLHNGGKWLVEAQIVRPLIKVTKLPADANTPDRFILFPYTEFSGSAVIPEGDLRLNFPKAYAYLCAQKEGLCKRDRGKIDKYPAWYAYGRSQGLHDLSNRDVVFVPTMIGGSSRPRLVNTQTMTCKFGAPLFVSGFAVSETEQVRNKLLSQDFIEYVREHGSPKPGAKELYYSISSKHINAFLQYGSEVAAQ